MSEPSCQVCSAPTDAFLCGRCTTRLERACGDFAGLLGELAKVRARQTNVYRSGVGRRQPEPVYDPEADVPAWLRTKDGRITLRPTALPVNLDASELEYVAWNTITTWARDLAEHRGLTSPGAREVLIWLADSAEAFRWQDNAAEAFDELTAVHAQLERAVDRSPERLYAGPCREDGCELDLYGWPNRDTIECDGWRQDGEGCGAVHTTEARRDWLAASVEEHNVNLRDMWEAAPTLLGVHVDWETVRKWPRERRIGARLVPARLLPVGADFRGEPLYRGSEVVRLLRDEETRAGARRAG